MTAVTPGVGSRTQALLTEVAGVGPTDTLGDP